MDNLIVISRQIEIQQIAQKVAKNVFAADSIAEAIEHRKRISPELIVFDQICSQKDLLAFLKMMDQEIDTPHIVVIGDDHYNIQVDTHINDKELVHFIDTSCDENHLFESFTEIINNIDAGLSKDDINTDTFFSDEFAASASIVGKSKSITHTLRMIKVVARSRCNPILIVGEMGTGKELAAKALHNHRCQDKEFIAVNCASLSANLLESELFGHEKGAFTSAEREKKGLLELAGEGCIFLDEISEMPQELQAKLLRVIQEKTFRKVGGTKEIECQATIIASSNRDLKEEVKANRFRGDLYHRLSIFPVVLSPLRSPGRREDIRLLAEYFLKSSSICPEKSGQTTSITKMALEALENYDWPGNVRELRNVIERAILLESTDKISVNSIIIDPEKPEEFFNNKSDKKMKDYSLAKAEQELIARVLQETNWQKTKAAELLGISRATLYAKVKQHNIETDSGRSKSKTYIDSSEEEREPAMAP